MRKVHAARIHWSQEQIRHGLPVITRTIDPAWFPEDHGPPVREGWSLMCEFEVPPSDQGDPSTARVQFMVDAAPHERLAPGTSLRLFERATQKYAHVEILD